MQKQEVTSAGQGDANAKSLSNKSESRQLMQGQESRTSKAKITYGIHIGEGPLYYGRVAVRNLVIGATYLLEKRAQH